MSPPPFDGLERRRETRSVPAKEAVMGPVDEPVPEELLAALRVLYTKSVNTRAAGRRVAALVAVAEALEHIVEHDDDESVLALEQLAKVARRYGRDHECYQPLGAERLPNRLLAPERAELIKDLVSVAEDRLRRRHAVAKFLLMRVAGTSTAAVLAHRPASGWGDRVVQEVQRAQDLGHDAEGLVVAALVGWGLKRARARALVKSALRRSG